MTKQTITLNKALDPKTTAAFVQKAGIYTSNVKLTAREITVDAKSIMGVMTLVLRQGNEVTLAAEGIDAEKAVTELAAELV